MKNNSAHTKCAYTLVELLVVITISLIVFTVGYAGYREFSRRQALTGVIKSVTSDLRRIQQLALTGQKPTSGSCTKLVGYSFTRTSSSNYQLNANCDNSGTMVTRLYKSVDLTGITFTATTASTMFKVLGQGTNLTNPNTLRFTHTSTGTFTDIVIGTGGDVQ